MEKFGNTRLGGCHCDLSKKNSSLNVVELWVTKETDESEVQSALRKYQQQGIFVCIFRSGTKDCVELTQELLRTNLT